MSASQYHLPPMSAYAEKDAEIKRLHEKLLAIVAEIRGVVEAGNAMAAALDERDTEIERLRAKLAEQDRLIKALMYERRA